MKWPNGSPKLGSTTFKLYCADYSVRDLGKGNKKQTETERNASSPHFAPIAPDYLAK